MTIWLLLSDEDNDDDGHNDDIFHERIVEL